MRIPSLFGTDLTAKPKPVAPAAASSSVNPFTGILQGSKQPQASLGFGSESLSKSAASLTTQPSSSSSLFGLSQFGSTATTITSSSSSSLFGGPKSTFQIGTSGGNKPTFTGLFGSGNNNQNENRLGASSSSLTTAFGGIPQRQQQQQEQQVTSNNARKLDTIRREFGVPASAITTSTVAAVSSTNLDSHFEHIFDSICLQLIRDFCQDFLTSQRIIEAVCKNEIDSLIQNVVAADTRAIANQQLTQYR